MSRHPLHSICPYFAMFPEEFAERHVLSSTSVGDVVFDPFSGRGTTVFQSLLLNRQAAGTDINPVAACISGAKANSPLLLETLKRIDELRSLSEGFLALGPTEFFQKCFHADTFSQLMFLRKRLRWLDCRVDRFIAAMVLGALHGESHKSRLCFSNRMPRTISTKPEYSIRWWAKNEMVAPKRDVFAILNELARFRLNSIRPVLTGEVALTDAREAASRFPHLLGRVKLVVTSPPYIDVTDYAEDQWLRLWFLGGGTTPQARIFRDDRHVNSVIYWKFLEEVWSGLEPLLTNNSRIVIRIGGKKERDEITEGLQASLLEGISSFDIIQSGDVQTTSLKKRQTNSFRPGTMTGVEHDYVFDLVKKSPNATGLANTLASST